MSARRKTTSQTRTKGSKRRSPAGGGASRSKARRKAGGRGAARLDQRGRRRSTVRKAGGTSSSRGKGRLSRARKRTTRAASRAVKAAELAVELVIRVANGSDWEAKRITIAGVVRPPRRAAPNGFPGVKDRETVAQRVARGTRPDKLARLLAAIAHTQRLVILLKLLAGEATHKLLTKATGLKAGPLYYHLRELREAGLIGPRVRDLYVLTRQGRRIILAAMATERLCR